MTDQNWVAVLESLYQGPLTVNEEMAERDGIEHELVGYLSNQDELSHLSEEQITTELDKLKRTGLIRATGTNGDGLTDCDSPERFGGLTSEGFQVVHDRQMAERQKQSNDAVAEFTSLLVLVGIIQALSVFGPIERPLTGIAYGIIIIAAYGLWYVKLGEYSKD